VKLLAIKSLLLAALTCANTTCFARWPEYVGFWVIGNYAKGSCEIITANPVIDSDGNTIWFADGPYKSLDDAKLARSTIRQCPKDDLSVNGDRTPE